MTTLGEIGDVTITSPQNGDKLVRSGGAWINQAIGGGWVLPGGADPSPTMPGKPAIVSNLGDLDDVLVDGPAALDRLVYYNGIWRNFPLWHPAMLYSSSEQGYWLDPSDFSTMFQDTAGTTPVTAVGQAVARINDKSGRGNHFTQSSASLRPLLQVDGAGKYYLDFDGTDDEMESGSITPGTNKVQVFAGVRKNSDASVGAITGNRTAIAEPDGFFEMLAPDAVSAATFALEHKGTGTRRIASTSGNAAPILAVLHGYSDLAGPLVGIRVNSAAAVEVTTDPGGGNFAAGVYKIGRRAATGVRFEGRIYQLMVRFGPNLAGAASDAARQFVAGKTGVSL